MHYSSFIGQKDANKGRYGSIENGPLGTPRAIYNNAYDADEDLDQEEEDLFVRDEIRNQIKSIIFPDDLSAKGLEPQRRDLNSFASPTLIEISDHLDMPNRDGHTTTARTDTSSPFSHRILYPNGLGPPIGGGGSDDGGQIYRTTGNFRYIGSEEGWVSPHKPQTEIDDDPVYDIRNIPDPMERSFKRHQKSVKLVLDKINECLRDN